MSSQTHSGKVGTALVALSATLVAALAGTFLLIQSFFPWMTVLNPRDTTPASGAAHGAGVVDVTDGGPTPAQRTLQKAMGIAVPQLQRGGWSEIRAGAGVPGVSFGFGCDPTDGLAPVVAQSRSWVQSRTDGDTSVASATGTVDVSARAYPAGGGAVAFTGLTEAVLRCDAASLYPSSGVGVEVAQVSTATSASLVWRRGDVIMVGTVTSHGHAGSIGANMAVFRRFDAALDAALSATCLDQNSGVDDAHRSPYVNRAAFAGDSEVVRVKRTPTPGAVTAEDRTTDPVVPIPGPHVPLPYVSTLPTPPVPPITEGPAALPAPVPSPSEPVAPTGGARNVTGVSRQIDDPAGPGCGWAFTGQVAPHFNADAAQRTYQQAVRVAKQAMARSWRQWQDAKVAYYAAYAEYRHAATRYRHYATTVAAVEQAWAVVETARSGYYTALDAYNAAVAAAAQWHADRAQARADYRAAQQACRDAADPTTEPTSQPSGQPSPTPSGPTGKPSPKPTKPTSTSQPSATPTPTASPTPVLVCPPTRPAILDEQPPTVPPSPVPAPEAQLPTPSVTPSASPGTPQG